MTSEPNFFEDRTPWLRIYFGGVLCRAALTKVNDVSTEDEWKEQKSKETSGKVQVFSGTKKNKFKLTFLAHDTDSYRWLQEHWEMLKPVPVAGGTGGPVAPTGGTSYSAAASAKPGAVGYPPTPGKADAVDAASDTKSSATAKDNPGPRPPTIGVDYPSLLRHGITACARAKWTDLGPTETNGYEVEVEYTPQDPPKPAGGGALAPAKPGSATFTGGAPAQGGPGGTGSPAAAQAAGT